MKTTKIEVENGELALKNSHGDIAIIPKHLRQEVEGMIADKCYGCLDKLISQLPRYGAKAKDGMVVKDTDLNKQGKTYEQYKSMLAEKNPNLAREDDSIYDLRGAWQAGLEPELVKHNDGTEAYHLGSRDPETGLLLKRESHPTYDLMLQGEKEAGYEVYEENGRLYSRRALGDIQAEAIANDARANLNRFSQGQKMMNDFQEANPNFKGITVDPQQLVYPSDDLRRDGVVPHNAQYMAPNLEGKTKSDFVKSTNDIIGITAPVPGLNNVGKLPGIIDKSIEGVGKIAKGVTKLTAAEKLSNSELLALRAELKTKGILKSQKTLDLPWKEPIRKGVEPWGYTNDNPSMFPITGSKYKDVKGAIFGGPNPSYLSDRDILMRSGMYDVASRKANDLLIKQGKPPIYTDQMEWILKHDTPIINDKRFKDAINHRDRIKYTEGYENMSEKFAQNQKNRYITWDMYLGKPQTKHPMYDVSELTKSKKDIVYTIKEDFMDKAAVEKQLNTSINRIEKDIPFVDNRGKVRIKPLTENKWMVPDKDSYFGTMGGFHWEIEKLADGNYKAIANDVWDIQPLKNRIIGDTDKLSGRLLNKAIKPIQNIEAGKAFGIGKPLNVKVGFIIDGNTKKIINTFGLSGAAVGVNSLNNNKNDK